MSEEDYDKQLVEAALRGNRGAFDVLVLKYQDKIFQLISRYINDFHEARDITQEIFIRAYSSLSKFRKESAFYTWIYRIAINTAKNYLLAASRTPPCVAMDVIESYPSGGKTRLKEFATPENLLICAEVETAIYQAIDNLAEDLRIAIQLREMLGLSYEEIAIVMNCPVGTVRSRIYRAREVLEESIKHPLPNNRLAKS